jgi:restriction system protein
MADTPKLFLVRAGRMGEDEDYALDHGLAIIGFHDVPSLEGAKDYEGVYAIVEKSKPADSPRAVRNYAGQLWAFAVDMKQDELVVMPRKTTAQIAIGRVAGAYRYTDIGGTKRHTRAVRWIKTDIPRVAFQQDLLHSFGAFMTVCTISRNDAARRVLRVLEGGTDSMIPTASPNDSKSAPPTPVVEEAADERPDLALSARDQIAEFIEKQFKGHALTELVEAVLQADGWVTKRSPPGPDGGVDILAGRGLLGLDAPRLAVQVKSQTDAADVTVYRTLQGSMQSFKAEQGLLVCWGGFNKVVLNEAKTGHFGVRLWDSDNLIEAIFRCYGNLPKDIQARLPLKQVWMLVDDETALG